MTKLVLWTVIFRTCKQIHCVIVLRLIDSWKLLLLVQYCGYQCLGYSASAILTQSPFSRSIFNIRYIIYVNDITSKLKNLNDVKDVITKKKLDVTTLKLIQSLNTSRLRQNGCHFPDDIFKWIFFNENVWILIKISLKFVSRGQFAISQHWFR